jgi:acetyl-CoA carboxylase carboxyl transferase subunit beta
VADAREGARDLVEAVTTGFTEFPAPAPDPGGDGPIDWAGYGEARRRAVERTGEQESVVCGVGTVGGVRATLIAFEFGFLGGSLGRRTGDRIEAAFARARELGTPVVTLIATGGSRMQEGMAALSQLQRIAGQIALTRAARVPLLSVLRDPATGGGWATLGAAADVTLALPGAQVGFAGSRVRPGGQRGYAPTAYTAESHLATGQVDQIVPRDELPQRLARWLALLTGADGRPADPPAALGTGPLPGSGWESVTAARAPERPRADAYLDDYFDWRQDISGDRCGGVDPGVRCGFGSRRGVTVAYAAQCGTPTLPAGFRTAARLIRLADRLRVPVLTLVDTPGAANDAEAERAGAGPAIAEVFTAVAEADVPITTLVIGEGGSGGALAFAAPGRTWITPDAYFSVTSPEAATAILKLPSTEVRAVAGRLRLRPGDLAELGLAEVRTGREVGGTA